MSKSKILDILAPRNLKIQDLRLSSVWKPQNLSFCSFQTLETSKWYILDFPAKFCYKNMRFAILL